VFGNFLKELLAPHCELTDSMAPTIILAVPASAYEECGRFYGQTTCHLVNVCSIQKPTTDALLKYTDNVTSIHPLFGKRTPADKRNSILTLAPYQVSVENDTWSMGNPEHNEFMEVWKKVSTVSSEMNGIPFTPEMHDILMAKTHGAAVMAAKQLKVFTDRVKDLPDEFIPNSFRLMRDFVKTLDDMPQGTIESILANPYL
jgi:prephenate dehydrogenase